MLEEDCRGMPVVICFNSQAALGELDRYLFRSREVLRCKEFLGKKADRLANTGARAIRATRCSVGLRASYLDEMLENGSVNGSKVIPGRKRFEVGEVAHRRTAK